MRVLFLSLLSLAGLSGDTPNIHGTIFDPSGRPVEGARVSCQNRDAYSNAEGHFTLSDLNYCDAHIERTGFEGQFRHLSSQTETKIVLKVAGPTETVVVSATRSETTPEQAAVAATVITSDQLAALNFPMLFETLRDVPGVQVSQYGPPGSLAQIFTRGAERTGTLVMIDGVPLNDPGGELHAEHLTTEGVDRVEIVRGPESALFGAEAAAAVIQIFTKRGSQEDKIPHGSFSYERGGFQTDRWMANLAGGDGSRLDYSLAASEFHTVGLYQNTYDRDNTGTANVGYKLSDRTQLRGIFHIYDDHTGTPGQTAYGVDDPVPSEETRDEAVALRLDDSRGSNYQQQFTFGFHKLSDRYNDDEPFGEQPLAALVRIVPGPPERIYFVKLLNPANVPIAPLPSNIQLIMSDAFFGPSDSLNKTERKRAGYQGTLSYHGGGLVFGYDYENQSGFLSGTNASRNNNGFFFNIQQAFGSRVFFSGGARFEHSSAFGNIGSGRGGVSLLLSHEHGALSSASLRISGGRGVTEPSLLENYAQSPYFFGNPNLRPEETTTYEAGLVTEWFNRRIRAEITGFRNSFHNLIAFVGESWQNVDASWARGFETSAQARLPHHILLNGTYMWLDTRITNSVSPEASTTGIGEPLVHRPRNSGSISMSLIPRHWSFVAGARFIGERQDSDFTFGVTRNPGYESVYASASYQLTKHITPILRIDNLLNENYQDVLGYQGLSRNIIGGVRVTW